MRFPERKPVPRTATQLATCTTESLGFNWLRQVAVIRAYAWFFRRTHRWEQPRWQSSALAANETEPATSTQAA